jgi:hypothetical protein
VAIAAGCGGGSSSGPLTIPTPSPNPTISFPPPPSPLPTNNSYRPSPSPSETNLYQFTGFIEQWYARPPVTSTPLPSPNPTVTAVFVSSVTQNVQVTQPSTFNAVPGLVDYDIQETDTGIYGIFNTQTWLDDIYYLYTPQGNNTAVSEVGETSFLDLGAIDQTFFKTIYGAGNGLIDVIPEPSQKGEQVPITPANNAALTHTEHDPDGQVTIHTTHADGSYVEQATYPDGTSALATVNSNGSGSYSFPLGGAQPNSSVEVGLPAGGMIPVTVNYTAGSQGPHSPPNQVSYQIPTWYPQTPPTLSHETYFNFGPMNLPNPYPSPLPYPTPGACNLGQDVFGKQLYQIQGKPFSNDLIQTITKVDPVFGETETITTSTFVTQGVGATCWKIDDAVTQYYDYSGQTKQIPYFSGSPVQTSLTEITMGIAFATINNQSYRFGESGDRRGVYNVRFSKSQPMMRPGKSFSHQRSGLVQSPGGGSGHFQASDALLAVRSNFIHALDNARLKRHAEYWRELKAIRDRRRR